MSNVMKSTGKTVDEAVREALLRMGLRREEVSVTVLQESRGGFLGVGRRDAVVEVAKKSDSDDDRRRGSRRGGRRDRNDESRDRADARRGRDGGERRGNRRGDQDEEEKRSSRGRRGGRGRSRGRDRDEENREQPQAARDTKERREEPAASKCAAPGDDRDDRREGENQDGTRRRRRRPRRRRKPSAQVDEATVQQQNGGSEAEADRVQTEQVQADQDRPAEARDRNREEEKAPAPVVEAEAPVVETVDPEPPAQQPAVEAAEPVSEQGEDTPTAPPGTALVSDLVASNRVQPFGTEAASDQVDLLEQAATSLMVKAGFMTRVNVTPGEYHQVKMVVDDRSAGVLIGRAGSTVDAVEHLVERIATRTVGERVKLNLDINNYRLRREDGLLGQTRRAINEARDTGQPVFMDPAGGRERRIVHLEVAEEEGLVTYTDQGERGKCVVICLPEQVPAEYRDPELHGPAPEESRPEA